jgi:hypothetical protein
MLLGLLGLVVHIENMYSGLHKKCTATTPFDYQFAAIAKMNISTEIQLEQRL